MTDKRDYIIEITARRDPLACFKMIEEQVGKGFSPAFGEKMLTHTNNPKIISMLAERTAAALAQGGDFAAYEALVFGIVAGREINDDTRGKLQEAAAPTLFYGSHYIRVLNVCQQIICAFSTKKQTKKSAKTALLLMFLQFSGKITR